MGKRRKGREVALQFLYQLDLHGAGDPLPHEDEFWGRHPVDRDTRSFAESLVRGSKQHQSETDQLITQYAEHWDLDRMAVVDRNILRLAVHELLWRPTCRPRCHQRGHRAGQEVRDAESSRFINGLLDRILRGIDRPPRSAATRPEYAILSDVHGNLEALRAVLADAAGRRTPCCAWATPWATAPTRWPAWS